MTGRPIALEAQDVTFGYVDNRPVLQNWGARFAPGTMTALTGPSGHGKSTLFDSPER